MQIAVLLRLITVLNITVALQSTPGAVPPDPELVAQKIHALGQRDETLPSDEQPYQWLWQRKEEVSSALIAGLASTNEASARQCLRILADVHPSPELTEALLRIAGDRHHALHLEATLGLCRFAGEPRVASLLRNAWTNRVAFADPRQQATLAETLGLRREAAELLAPLLDVQREVGACLDVIHRLATNGHPSAIAPLEKATHDPRWRVNAEARLSLAEIDPGGYALSASQKTFIRLAGLRFKETEDLRKKRCQELAQLPLDEIRPLLRAMLVTDEAGQAALLCGLSGDTEAIPQIRRGALESSDGRLQDFVTGWFLLDQSDAPVRELSEKIRNERSDFKQEQILRGVARAELSMARKLALLRRVRDQLGLPRTIARSVASANQPELLAVLFDEEKDFEAQGDYASSMTLAPNPEYEKALRRAVENIVETSRSEPDTSKWAYAARNVLRAAAALRVSGVEAAAVRMMATPEPSVSIAAARLAASGPERKKALALLHQSLTSVREDIRSDAARNLLALPCAGDAERIEREQAALPLVGGDAEDGALLVLTTCGGQQSIARLEPLLDSTNVAQAVYAAWVLAQLPEPVAAEKALRRIALHALFHHELYQKGAGIDFEITRGLNFHQVAERLDPGAYPDDAGQRVRIPGNLMMPQSLSQAEQTFLLRDYRWLMTSRREHWAENYFLLFSSDPSFHGGQPPESSYVPFFEAVIREDPELKPLYVAGNRIAHFPNRQAAARNLARLTGKTAVYSGLEGESLAPDEVPQHPYPEQDAKIARFLIDRIVAANLTQPRSDREWESINYFSGLITRLTNEEQFGLALKEALLDEVARRQLADKFRGLGLRW